MKNMLAQGVMRNMVKLACFTSPRDVFNNTSTRINRKRIIMRGRTIPPLLRAVEGQKDDYPLSLECAERSVNFHF